RRERRVRPRRVQPPAAQARVPRPAARARVRRGRAREPRAEPHAAGPRERARGGRAERLSRLPRAGRPCADRRHDRAPRRRPRVGARRPSRRRRRGGRVHRRAAAPALRRRAPAARAETRGAHRARTRPACARGRRAIAPQRFGHLTPYGHDMRIFEPHAHMFSRVTDDYQRMYAAGIRAVLEPAFWLGQARTSVGTFVDYFDTLIGWERFRAEQFGVHHFCTMALNPREANDDRVNAGVLEILPRYLEKDSVLGVGEIGLDDQTAKEEKYLIAQIELAARHDLPILVHTPHRD